MIEKNEFGKYQEINRLQCLINGLTFTLIFYPGVIILYQSWQGPTLGNLVYKELSMGKSFNDFVKIMTESNLEFFKDICAEKFFSGWKNVNNKTFFVKAKYFNGTVITKQLACSDGNGFRYYYNANDSYWAPSKAHCEMMMRFFGMIK